MPEMMRQREMKGLVEAQRKVKEKLREKWKRQRKIRSGCWEGEIIRVYLFILHFERYRVI